jgi:hypothetical protein
MGVFLFHFFSLFSVAAGELFIDDGHPMSPLSMGGTGRILLSAKTPADSDLIQPEILTDGVEQNVTAAKGTTAYLHCRVKNLGTRAVRLKNPLSTPLMLQHILALRLFTRQCIEVLDLELDFFSPFSFFRNHRFRG